MCVSGVQVIFYATFDGSRCPRAVIGHCCAGTAPADRGALFWWKSLSSAHQTLRTVVVVLPLPVLTVVF